MLPLCLHGFPLGAPPNQRIEGMQVFKGKDYFSQQLVVNHSEAKGLMNIDRK